MSVAVRNRRRLAPFAVLAALVLGGCQISPLYVPTPGTATAVSSTLAAIAIPAAGDRLTQVVRNNLMFHFNNGQPPAAPRYEMSLVTRVVNGGVGVGTNRVATVYVTYAVLEIATGQQVAAGTLSAQSGFEQVSNQAFANLSAENAAAEQAASAVATELWMNLSAQIAAGTFAAPPAAVPLEPL